MSFDTYLDAAFGQPLSYPVEVFGPRRVATVLWFGGWCGWILLDRFNDGLAMTVSAAIAVVGYTAFIRPLPTTAASSETLPSVDLYRRMVRPWWAGISLIMLLAAFAGAFAGLADDGLSPGLVSALIARVRSEAALLGTVAALYTPVWGTPLPRFVFGRNRAPVPV